MRKRFDFTEEVQKMYFHNNSVPKELVVSHMNLLKMLVDYINERLNRLIANIGLFFTEWLELLLEPYRGFAQQYPDSLLVWSKRFEDNPVTKALIAQVCTETGYTVLEVRGFLIKPVQRISSFYIIVLEELNKECGNACIATVVANMRKLAVKVNEATPLVHLDYGALYLPCTEGGYVEKRGGGEGRTNWKTRFMQIHLDAKVVSYCANETKKEKKKNISFESIMSCDSVHNKGEQENAFTIQTKEKTFVFQVSSSRQKDLWLWAVMDIIINNTREKSKTLDLDYGIAILKIAIETVAQLAMNINTNDIKNLKE